jgi:hypothetical protein
MLHPSVERFAAARGPVAPSRRASGAVGYPLMWFDIGGAATLAVAPGTEPALAGAVAGAFVPYRPRSEPVATVGVSIQPLSHAPRFQDIENRAGDGLVTAYDGERAYILHGRHACVVPDPLRDAPAAFAYTPGFPMHELVRSYVRTAVSLTALRTDAVVVHASAVSIHGRAVLIGGWSESGKTEIALALAEAGAEFISDKWTIVRSDGSVCPFPASVGVRRWVLPYLPKLRARLPRTATAQLAGAAALSLVSRPLRRSFRNAVLREAGSRSTQLVALAERAALSVEQVRAAYGNVGDVTTPLPLGLVVLLSTVAHGTRPAATSVETGIVARRLAQAAAFERRTYFSVTERVRYGGASPDRTDGPTVAGIEESLLRARLTASGVLEVRTPFPGDPRRAAESILGHLEVR